MRVGDLKADRLRKYPRIFEFSGSDEADLARWVDDLVREEANGWPFPDSTWFEDLLVACRELVEIGDVDPVPWLVRTVVEDALRYEAQAFHG